MKIIWIFISLIFTSVSVAAVTPKEIGSGSGKIILSKRERLREISGTFSLTNNYVFRGISQTFNKPALQGEFTWSLKGFYIDVFGSNVDFNDDNATFEIDPTIGYQREFSSGVGLDIGISRYTYPKTVGLDYNESYLIVSYKMFYGTITFSDNYSNSGKNSSYYQAGIDYEIPEKFARLKEVRFLATVGHSDLPPTVSNSYNDYGIGLAKRFFNKVDLLLAWTTTDGRADSPPVDRSHFISKLIVNF